MRTISDTIFEENQECLFSLHNLNGIVAQFTNYGARWISMLSSDKLGILDDVVLGFNNLDDYFSAKEQYHGAIVGRVCGRINNACFKLNEKEYHLAANDAYGQPQPNHLHGGNIGFHNRFWNGRLALNEKGEEIVVFTYVSDDGEEGYPGKLSIKIKYTLRNDNVLCMECTAVSDKETPVNLTNHTFFNLAGKRKDTNILSHDLQINSDRIINCDTELIPTGNYISVIGTELDFTKSHKISEALQSSLFQIKENEGFTLAFALAYNKTGELPLAAELFDEFSGRKLSIYTNQPSLQVYTGYFMDGTDLGKGGYPYRKSAGIALETQGFPDAVNHPDFPSIILAPGKIYDHYTEYKFSIQ